MDDNQGIDMKEAESQSDLRKFAVFLAVIFVLILVMAAISEPLGERVFPAILGLEGDADTNPDNDRLDPVTAGSFEGPISQQLLPLLKIGDTLELKDAIKREVQAGETVFEIATEFGVAVPDIAFVNRLESPDQVEEGDILFVPIIK